MSLVNVYSAIESRLTAHATFSGYNFFRHYSEKATNAQTKTRIPYLALVFDEERSTRSQKWGIQSRAVFSLYVRWASSYTDLDALGRMTEFSQKKTAVLQSILASSDHEWLGLPGVANIEITTERLRFGVAIEEITDNGLKSTIAVDYYEGRA